MHYPLTPALSHQGRGKSSSYFQSQIILISTNLFGRLSSSIEEILAEQVLFVYMESTIWEGN